MSGRITPASQARMNRRDEFVQLTPWNNIDVVRAGENLPCAEIVLRGLPGEDVLAELILEAIEVHLKNSPLGPYKLVKRKAA